MRMKPKPHRKSITFARQHVECATQRRHRLVVVRQGEARNQCIDDGQLGQSAGHRLRAETCLARHGVQHHIGMLLDGRFPEIGDAYRARAGLFCQPRREYRFVCTARMRNCQHSNVRPGQRGADRLHMRIGNGRRLQADAQHAIVRVVGNDGRTADAVDLDPARTANQIHCRGQRLDVQHRFGLLQRLDVAMKDLADHLCRRILRSQIFVDVLHRLHDLLRQRDFQLLKTRRAQQFAKTHHTAFAALGALGDFTDRHVDDICWMTDDEFADTLRGGAH